MDLVFVPANGAAEKHPETINVGIGNPILQEVGVNLSISPTWMSQEVTKWSVHGL